MFRKKVAVKSCPGLVLPPQKRKSDDSFAFMDLENNNLALDVFSLKEVNVQVEYLYDIQNLLETLLEIKKIGVPF